MTGSPTPISPGGLPLAVWANLPLLACLIFAVVIAVGVLVIMRETRRVNRERLQADRDEAPPSSL
ncbi:MAG: hypothetical protein RMN24_10360 [Anaerolineae bacterium]|nr:hypothetical protein [Caldilineales bacterium]MCX7852869.1 hypothetical protein [Caldilineales bacterium]MDW8269555.1 hypothetical protein [Anaerolineae bacterium]